MEEPKSTAKRRAKTVAAAQEDKITLLPLSELHDFPNHPFKVRDDEAMQETAESIRQYGVLVPAIVRPREDGGYEIIAGHRRRHGSELAGLSTMPCIVRQMDDDTATILMVDSNIQRENILPSERAQAYKMKLEAIRRKAGRPARTEEKTDENNSPQVAANFSVSKKSFRHAAAFFRTSKALKNGDHHRAGHPSRVSRTHPSAPLTKASRFFDRLTGRSRLAFILHRRFWSAETP